MILTSTVELDAVNTIIGAIGEAPLNSIEDTLDVDASNAFRILNDVSGQEQARGWSFNIHENYVLNPDVNTQKILWADNFLFLQGSNNEKYIKQGNYVYDITNNTTTFTTPLTVTAIFFTPLDTLPVPLRSYIVAKAALKFQIRYLGDSALTVELEKDVKDAWATLQEFEIDSNSYNLLENDNVVSMLER